MNRPTMVSRTAPRPAGQTFLRVLRPAGATAADTVTGACEAGSSQTGYDANGNLVNYTCVNGQWSGSAAGGGAPGSNPASNPSVTQGVFNTIGSALGTSGPVIAAAINAGNQTEIARINAEAQRFRDQLTLQMQQNPAQAGAFSSQLAAVNNLIAQTSSQTNTYLYIGLGVAAVAAVGLILYTQRGRARRNPSHANPVVVTRASSGEKRRRFINAKKYRAMQARAGR